MDRTKFFNTIVVNGIEEVDFTNNTLSSFTMKRQPDQLRVDEHMIGRPDSISNMRYGTSAYWWVICLVNGIRDPLNDISVGDLLKIPSKIDIFDFYKKFKVRK
jgi:hypothetical protein